MSKIPEKIKAELEKWEKAATNLVKKAKQAPKKRAREDIIDDTSKLAVVNFPARDLARLMTFHRIAEKTDRKLVLSFKHAYLLEQFQALGDDYPLVSDSNLCFFADRKG